MHFENLRHGLLREGKRREGEWAVCAKGGGMNRKYRSCKIKVNTAAMSVIKNKRFLFFPPPFAHTAHSPSLRLPSRSNPRPHFPKRMENDVTSVRPR